MDDVELRLKSAVLDLRLTVPRGVVGQVGRKIRRVGHKVVRGAVVALLLWSLSSPAQTQSVPDPLHASAGYAAEAASHE